MKFKVGDKVHFDSFSQKGVGTIVAVKDSRVLPYLVHSLDIKGGHDSSGEYHQDNTYNYWFLEYHLDLVTNDYITTKDFIKEVEKLGYEFDRQDSGIIIKSIEGRSLVVVRLYELMQINTITYDFGLHGVLFDLVVKYAKTPIEFREEPKKYTLELPNTTIKARYFRFGLPHAKHSYKFGALPKSTTNSDIDYQTYFTQQEIDNLPNQELIKCLIEKEVKND